MSFSELLKQCRKKQGVSQAELASKLGVTQQAVGKWESGKSSPDPTTVARIAELLNTYFRKLSAGPVPSGEQCICAGGAVFRQLFREPDPGYRYGEGRLRRPCL